MFTLGRYRAPCAKFVRNYTRTFIITKGMNAKPPTNLLDSRTVTFPSALNPNEGFNITINIKTTSDCDLTELPFATRATNQIWSELERILGRHLPITNREGRSSFFEEYKGHLFNQDRVKYPFNGPSIVSITFDKRDV